MKIKIVNVEGVFILVEEEVVVNELVKMILLLIIGLLVKLNIGLVNGLLVVNSVL